MSKDAINDILELFDISPQGVSEAAEDSSDYSTTAGDDKGAKPNFDELINEVGDRLGGAAEGAPALPVKSVVEEKPKVVSPKEVEKKPAVVKIEESKESKIEKALGT